MRNLAQSIPEMALQTVAFSPPMTPLQFSSGDLIADRRADYAEGLLAMGEAAAAADLYEQALALVPLWTAGWYRLGEIRAEHDLPGCEAAFEAALRLDPLDALGAGPRLDLLRGQAAQAQMPSAFVEALFDQYAGNFDHALVETLDYRIPVKLRARLPGRFRRVLDLGCGTGLMGSELRAQTDWLEGWDISAEMLREAEAKGIYDRLAKVDLSQLDPPQANWDLITATDVFAYLGPLGEIFDWCAAALARGGILGFSAEAALPGAEAEAAGVTGCVMRDSRRYAHDCGWLRSALEARGFAVEIAQERIRMDRGAPIEGYMIIARRS